MRCRGLPKRWGCSRNTISTSRLSTYPLLQPQPRRCWRPVEVGLLGGIGVVNAFVNGATDLVLIGSIKNFMTQSILAKPEVTKLQELKGKKIGVTRIGSNTHYFSVQAFRRAGMNPEKDVLFIQTGGDAETLGALFAGRIDAASLLPPADAKAIAQGFRYVVSWARSGDSLCGLHDHDSPFAINEKTPGHRQIHARDG